MPQQKPLVKKNILDFSGFVYADPVKEREKDRAKLLGYHLPVIHSLLDLFDLARGSGDAGTKVRPGRRRGPECACDERTIAKVGRSQDGRAARADPLSPFRVRRHT